MSQDEALDYDLLSSKVREAVVSGMTEVLSNAGDVKPVAVSSIGEGAQQIYTRPPTGFIDHDTNNLRALFSLFDAKVEVMRQELVTRGQEVSASQSRGLLKHLENAIDDDFGNLSIGLSMDVADPKKSKK